MDVRMYSNEGEKKENLILLDRLKLSKFILQYTVLKMTTEKIGDFFYEYIHVQI